MKAIIARLRRLLAMRKSRSTGRTAASDDDEGRTAYDEFADWTPGADW